MVGAPESTPAQFARMAGAPVVHAAQAGNLGRSRPDEGDAHPSHYLGQAQRPANPKTYLGGPRGVWVKLKQSDMLSAEPSRWLIDGRPKFSSQNFTMLTKECSVFEI